MSAERTDSRLRWSLALGRVTLTSNGGTVQQVQAQFTGDRLVEPVRLVQHFGLASRPPVGSEVVALFLGGDPVNAIAVASNDQSTRPTDLKEGDTKIFDKRGACVWLSEDGIQVEARGRPVVVRSASKVTVVASEKVRLETPLVEATQSLTVGKGASGAFTSKEGRVVTVVSGVVTKIV